MQLPVLSARRIEITASRSTRSFSRKCRLQVTAKHAQALDPTKSKWADSAIQIQCATHQGNELTGTSSGNACPQSFQPAEPLWTGPWPKRVKLVLGSLSPLLKKKERKSAGWEMIRRTFLFYPRLRGKATTTTTTTTTTVYENISS